MVTSVGAIILVLSLSTVGGALETKKVNVSVLAVQATNEGRATPRDEAVAGASKPKGPAGAPLLQQGFAAGLRDKPKPKKNGDEKERHFDAGLESIRDAVAEMPYDTFRKLKAESRALEFDKAGHFAINERYKLHLTPLDTDDKGRLRLSVAIDEQTTRNGQVQSRKALDTTSAIAPHKHLVLGGLPLAEGQLIIFISTEE